MGQLNQAIIYFNDISGNILPASKHTFFEAGTTTPKEVFSDSALINAITQPVVSSSAGILPQIWLEPGAYRWIGTDQFDNQLFDRDEINFAESEINTSGSFYFTDINDMQLGFLINGDSINLQAGQAAQTLFATATNDSLGAQYVIQVADSGGDVLLSNGLFAHLTGNSATPVDVTAEITADIATHNSSGTAHNDIRMLVGTNTTNIGTNTTDIATLNNSVNRSFTANIDTSVSLAPTINSTSASSDGVTIAFVSSGTPGLFNFVFSDFVVVSSAFVITSPGAALALSFSVSNSVGINTDSVSIKARDSTGTLVDDDFSITINYTGLPS